MPRSGFAGIGVAIVVALVVGCAGGAGAPKKRMDAGGGPATGFPTPEKLEELADEPILGRVFDSNVRDVEVWELEGPFPERVDERRIRRLGRPGVPSSPMRSRDAPVWWFRPRPCIASPTRSAASTW